MILNDPNYLSENLKNFKDLDNASFIQIFVSNCISVFIFPSSFQFD